MGDIADGMLNGLFCQLCGVVIDGEEPGYPRFCAGCEEEGIAGQREEAKMIHSARQQRRNHD